MLIILFFFSVPSKANRISEGELLLDSHAVVIARRSLLVFLYKQLMRLFEGRASILEYCDDRALGRVARISPYYKIHLYMKEAPCGDASPRDKKNLKNKKCKFKEHEWGHCFLKTDFKIV